MQVSGGGEACGLVAITPLHHVRQQRTPHNLHACAVLSWHANSFEVLRFLKGPFMVTMNCKICLGRT